MAQAGYEFLSTMRVNRVLQALQDVREMPQDLLFLGRTPVTPAMEGEIIGRWLGRILVADIVADDAAAVVYESGKLQFEETPVPNLKLGVNFTQGQLVQLAAIAANPGLAADPMFTNILNSKVDALLTGIRQRMEALIVAQWTNSLTYDRLGLKLSGISWGMPADLNVTTATAWTDPVNATPVNDVWGVLLVASTKYGMVFDRITMSTQAFRYMIATTEAQNKARMYLAPNISFANVQQTDIGSMRRLFSSILNCEIELYDARYWEKDAAGVISSAAFLPINKVVLSRAQNDNNPGVMDFANGVVTESIVAGLMPTQVGTIGGLGNGVRGPVAYSTVKVDLNPPALTLWAVARGWPRRLLLTATAALTVGNFTDTIPPIGDVF
jgi:hypothetical protein